VAYICHDPRLQVSDAYIYSPRYYSRFNDLVFVGKT
jgi:hypothetical protein